MKTLPGLFPKSVIVGSKGKCRCVNCKSVIKADAAYLLFTGESLHRHCLTDYLQRLELLKVVVRRGGRIRL